MIPLILLAAEPATASPEQLRYEACVALTETDPVRAVEEAGEWRMRGGGVLARQCSGLAYVAQKRWVAAAAAFELAAREAEKTADGRAAMLWVQAGNAALAGNDYAKARQFLDAALARGQLTGDLLGETWLDRARASAALGDLKAARSDLDKAIELVPADPLVWLLSATLARKMGDISRAQLDIEQAMNRSPDDASVALEAGNIALVSGAEGAARVAWQAATVIAPDSPAGKAAAEALARLDPKP